MQKQFKQPKTEQDGKRQRFETAARDRLARSGYYALRRVSCDFEGDVLKLRGRVPSYYEKQIAQTMVLSELDGTVLFENHLEVATCVA
jgi:hypothetical protein